MTNLLTSRWICNTLGSYPGTPTVVTSYDEFVPNEGDAIVQTDLKRDFPSAQKRELDNGKSPGSLGLLERSHTSTLSVTMLTR